MTKTPLRRLASRIIDFPLVRTIFQPAARYPADPRAVFILLLSVLTGILSFFLQAAPQTLNALLPEWGLVTWGLVLTFGSVATLAGLGVQNANGIIIEQIGSIMVGVACVFYGILALRVAGFDGSQPIIIVLGWGVACCVRWVQLQYLLRRETDLLHKARALTEIEKALNTEGTDPETGLGR